MAETTEPTVEQAAEHSAATAGHATGTTEAAEAHGSGGLPQFEFQHWGGQIAYLLILFVALYILMAKVFTPRIRRVFDQRAATISEAIASARAVQTEATEQAAAAQKSLAEARASAQKTASDAKAKADAESAASQAALEADLSAKQDQAEARIRAASDKAMTQLSAVAVDTAQAMIEKLTGAKTSRDAVSSAVAKLQG